MNEERYEEEVEIDLVDLFSYYARHLTAIILVTVVAAVVGLAGSKFIITPLYESSSMIYITATSGDAASNLLSNLQAGTALTADYKTLVTSRPVLEKVIDDLRLKESYKELSEKVTADNPQDTHILQITVKDPDPRRAKRIVDDLTTITVDQVAKVMDTNKPNVIQMGEVAKKPSSPSLPKNTAIAALIGLVLALGVLTFRYVRNDTINTPEDVEKYLGLDNLGMIPLGDGGKKNNQKAGRVRRNQRR